MTFLFHCLFLTGFLLNLELNLCPRVKSPEQLGDVKDLTTEHSALRHLTYLWFLKFLKVKWEAGTSSQLSFRRLGPSLL